LALAWSTRIWRMIVAALSAVWPRYFYTRDRRRRLYPVAVRRAKVFAFRLTSARARALPRKRIPAVRR
jgi:hypothetical protein